ncbi:sigma-70 family RNA polymerase sigma factor [Rhodoluna limnophila]|uniref:sigma-70 family RNA polymerase sigma factor n=1 Tax=Rhodoluna limnophila TaxID=232537 RepID=UPI0011072270|nr:sigma-70 family RNA polymerase sigma factor [Rhodoluna limnophila]
MSDITPLRPENNPEDANLPEDPFESMLDEESDEDFGYVVTRERAAGPDGRPVKLAEWSAQDFSSIYTRFRPHLERHARRFLNNQGQVDEVVQDAFLYLMVSLPELDSEIGVLRFLKWKTRLLCLDVIRASGKAYLASIDDVAEPASNAPEISSYLEQQDDAAVLRLALSKLNPRHREVLLASIYEEKSTDVIAAQVGLSENATRQLIFRARAAFKKALLGDDIDTNGMSAAAILSVAARKAAYDAKKVGAQAMVFALFLMLAVGAFIQVGGRGTQEANLAEVEAPSVTSPDSTTPGTTQSATPNASNSATPMDPTAEPVTQPVTVIETVISLPKVSNPAESASPSASPSESPFTQAAEAAIFDSSKSEVVFVLANSRPDLKGLKFSGDYVASASQGIYAEFTFDYSGQDQFSNVNVYFLLDGLPYLASIKGTDVISGIDQVGQEHAVFYGSVAKIFDKSGEAVSDSQLAESTIRIELVISKDKTSVTSTHLDLLSR